MKIANSGVPGDEQVSTGTPGIAAGDGVTEFKFSKNRGD
jgi:hypothetical protein